MKQYFAFQWHITDHCDQRCQHCYIFSQDHSIPLMEMGWSDIKAVLKNCLGMCTQLDRQPYFYITGGDPILHRDFWRLLELLKSQNIEFSVLGNPFHLNPDVCGKLKSYGCERYQMSIDGLKATHDHIRMPGSFDTTLEKIKDIKEAGLRSVIMTTVSGTNIKEIPEIIDLVVEHKVDVFAFARYCPTEFDPETHMEPQEYKELLEVCWERFEQYYDSDTVFNLKDHLWSLYLYEKGLYEIPDDLESDVIYDGCHCGSGHITILPDGDVYACRRMDSMVGNVFREKLGDIFMGPRMDKYRQYDKFKKCSRCDLLRFCRGCPAVAYGYTGNHLSSDPQCWKVIA